MLAAAVLAFWYLARARGTAATVRRTGVVVAIVAAQIALGIATLIHVVPIGLALAHQALAVLLLGAIVWMASQMTGVSVRRTATAG